ncbi:MAG: S-layer homology domain-containing protein [Acidimicrobiia bacterium]|nr:S-layer homology domain-containing protein [Acidimicrobiia bacterium]MDH4306978.1 S-layer homology domain-containing protein [Acidimicrobiia bacterium]
MRKAVFAAIAAALVMTTSWPAIAATGDFDDVAPSNVFADDIKWLAEAQITLGCNPPDNNLFCPGDNVTRGQMAAFLVRALGLTAGDVDTFTDDDNSVFQGDIEKLAKSGITRGCNPPTNDRFCPDDPVTRGQMAAFLVRALDLTESDPDPFTDDNGSVFEAEIAKLAHSGVTRGCNPPTNDLFCPDDFVTREQMAAFLHRALDLGIEGRLTLIRSIDASTYPSFDPTAVVYRDDTNELVLLDAPAEEQPGFSGINAWTLNLSGDIKYEWDTLGFTSEPAGGAWDPDRNELLIADDDFGVVYALNPGPDTKLGTGDDTVRSFDTLAFGAKDPEGLGFDPSTGQLFIINGTDSDTPEIFRLSPGVNGVLDGVPPQGDDVVVSIDVTGLGITDPEGGAFDPVNHTLLVVDRGTPGTVFELDSSGDLIEEFGISTTGADLASIELGPSSENPARRSLYLVDRGAEGVADGVVFEFRYD